MRRYIIILLLCAIAQYTYANRNYKFKHLSTDQGLPGVNVVAIHQDKSGVMWFGIEAVGLCRYDGNSYQVFGASETDSSTISNNFVTDIAEDKNGNLWVGTLNGLNIFNPITYECKRVYHDPNNNNSINSDKIVCITPDENGNIWIATSAGLSIFCAEKQQFYNPVPTKQYVLPQSIFTIYKSSTGDMYLGTRQNGMLVFSSEEVSNFNKQLEANIPFNKLSLKRSDYFPSEFKNNDNDININIIRSIAEINPDTLVIGVFQNIYLYYTRTRTFERINLNRSQTDLPAGYEEINVDNKGNIWCGSTSNGLLVYNIEKKQLTDFYYYNNPNTPVKTNDIRKIYKDQSGLIWIGGKFEGIYVYNYRQEIFNHLNLGVLGDNTGNVLCLTIENDSIVWLGTKSGGIKKLNTNTEIIENIAFNGITNTIPDKRIQALIKGDGNILYAGGLTGLWTFNTLTKKTELHKCSLINSLIKVKDKIWIGTWSGVLCFDEKTNKVYIHESKHRNLFDNKDMVISKLLAGKDDDIWIATTEHGLFKYYPANDSLVSYTYSANDTTSISGNFVRGLCYDNGGNLWVGTKASGLNKYNPIDDSFERINCIPDISARTIYSIVEDNNLNLWMGTHNGIIKYNPATNEVINFNEDYGLQGNVFEINAAGIMKNGLLLFGGRNGLNLFNPSTAVKQRHVAPVIITKFKIYDEIKDQNILTYKSYLLDKNSKYITFEYALLDYTEPKDNKYAYKLTPIDKDWMNSGNRTFVSYTNLPYGSYTFHIKAANSDGFWNEGTSISFVIPAPLFYQSWFRITLSVILLLLILAIIYYRIKSTKNREFQLKKIVADKTKALIIANTELIEHRGNLQKLVKKRTADLEKAKEKAEESDRLKSAFLANMSHEIRTPLNAILGFTSLIAADDFDKDELCRMNDIIQSNGSALLQLINDIIDISMIEANQLEIIKRNFDLPTLLKELHLSFQQQILLLKQKKNIEILIDIPDEDHELIIYTDRERLKQIFNNLFSNAVKFTESGYIKIGYSVSAEDENKIDFFIEDTGIGIDNKHLQEVFERFRKIESRNNELYRGTGLGLSICSNLITLLNGNINVKSSPGKGTTFYFSLTSEIKIKELNHL